MLFYQHHASQLLSIADLMTFFVCGPLLSFGRCVERVIVEIVREMSVRRCELFLIGL